METILLGLEAEYRTAYEDFQADEAIHFVAWLHIAGRRYTSYVDAAHRLGSSHWRPVVSLAESALGGRRPELAVDGFRAADQPGHHRDHLRGRCHQLTGVTLGDSEGAGSSGRRRFRWTASDRSMVLARSPVGSGCS